MSRPIKLAAPPQSVLQVEGSLYFVNVVQNANELSDPTHVVDNPKGTYIVIASTREEALNIFYERVPMRDLKDFTVKCMRITPASGYGGNQTNGASEHTERAG